MDPDLDDSDHQFGITVPPLVTYLKKILRDYSDGQIIKEILQNAEDAGAEKVKFLYDVRQYGTQTLFSESLAPYQGPALYSYNSAKFKQKDWEGIQKPARSNKQEDPLKVGRFGIGFNSVYHITDLPSIMSDHSVAFLDPLESHFRIRRRPQTGFRFNLQNSKDQQIFNACEDQFQPYRGLFDDVEDGISAGYFDGTLFRFPLRTTESDLCSKVYTNEKKMDDLLDAFLADADVVMLFLRSLREVEVLKRTAEQDSRLIASVKATVTSHEELSIERDQFTLQLREYCSKGVTDREDLHISRDVTISSENLEGSQTSRWIVCHHIAGASMSSQLSTMAAEQKFLPWTGIAAPINTTEDDRYSGRVFCFLPLPPGEESRTGLPVHLHGFFGLQSDRRAIKWPGPDQTDVPAKWNELLVRELIPSLYVKAITTAIDKKDISVESIYRTWPDEPYVLEKWKIIPEPFFNALFEERVIHSENNGWLRVEDVILKDLSVGGDMETVVLKCLLALKPLSKVSTLIVRNNGKLTLDKHLEEVLVKLGIDTLDCTDYVIRHPSTLSQGYIHLPVPDGILRATLNTDHASLANKLRDLKDRERELFIECIGNATINFLVHNILQSLPLFKTFQGSGVSYSSIVSARESIGYIGTSEHESGKLPHPVKLQRPVIMAQHSSKPLMGKLKIVPTSNFNVIMHVVREIDEGDVYNQSEVRSVILWLLRHWDEIKRECESSRHVLQRLKFVPTDGLSSTLKSPSELLDVRDPTLQELFVGKGFFPVQPFTGPEVLSALGQLGMRAQDRVTADEAIICLDIVSESNTADFALCFLKFLANNRHLMTSYSSRTSCTVGAYMKNKRCIPYAQIQPSFYPRQLQWHHIPSSCLSTPNETLLLSRENSMLCGSVLPLAAAGNKLLPVFSDLQMASKKPTLQIVIVQLRECVQLTQECREADVIELAPTVKIIYDFLLNEWREQGDSVVDELKAIGPVIWNGEGFSNPRQMCINELPFDLSPYMTQIPPAMRKFAELFRAVGVILTVKTDAESMIDIMHEVKASCDQSRGQDTAFHAKQLRLVMQILKQLQTIGELPKYLQDRILVPIEAGGCNLIPVAESAFVDKPWLKSDVNDEQYEEGETFTFVSPLVTADLADFLHVPPLSRLLVDADDLDGIIPMGQTEPLTVRISNILKNTYEDSAIFKEMIQNAEDAGATEVRFLVDMRKNINSMEKLFDEGMKSCQGPALWIFNDAVFTDEDFTNILRLGCRTKEKNPEKIGRFGIGFNSVYNLTDVPCFVSRKFIQYFDPQTTHLGNILPDKSQPGLRVNLQRTKQLRRFSDQFMPFNGVFGFQTADPFHYDGTLFRLPLRSEEAARKSELSRENYDDIRLKELLFKMWESCGSVLIFTRAVMKVSMYYLSAETTDASRAVMLFSTEKRVCGNTFKDNITFSRDSISQEMTHSGADYFQMKTTMLKTTFTSIRATCEGSEATERMAAEESEMGLSPRGEVAMALLDSRPSEIQGEVYCYLPLSMQSMLPVHVNGAFAVTDNRQHLYKSTIEGMGIRAKWNHLLLVDVVLFRGKYGSVSYDSLWPDAEMMPWDGDCSALFDAFYRAVVHGSPQPALFWKDGRTLKFNDLVFLSPELQEEDSIKAVTTTILETFRHNFTVVEVSDKTRRAFIRSGLEYELLKRTFDHEMFFDEIFLPQLFRVPDDHRNTIILYALNSRKYNLHQKLKDIQCIPVSGEKTLLRTPKDLVHPERKAAKLFSEADCVFPQKEFTSTQTLAALEELGMTTDCISAERFLTQCESVARLCAEKDGNALRRSQELIIYLSEMLSRDVWGNNNFPKKRLIKIAFLPVVSDGSTVFPFLPWISFDSYMPANSIYCLLHRNLVSSVAPVLHECDAWRMPRNVSCFLGIDERKPTLQEVMSQLRNIRSHVENGNVSHDTMITCGKIYKYLNKACRRNPQKELMTSLKEDKWILINKLFVSPLRVAKSVTHYLEPYLFKLPSELAPYSNLVQIAGIQNTFKASDYQKVLQEIYTCSEGKPLQTSEVAVAISIARLLGETCIAGNAPVSYFPDDSNVMRPSTDLCYDDADWVNSEDGQLNYCHHDISIFLARQLNIRDIRQQMLEPHAENLPGEEFGQRVNLTPRIKRILESYSGKEAVLKELLQNADDAGATEIHILYDPRSHGNKVFSDNMEPLQGPALCVFNNQSFSRKDIMGIQDLGEGSKRNEMSKIGRFGVGFNTVYHLSDCPSFITDGRTLCIFDPLLTHIPGASSYSPGRLYNITDKMRQTYTDVFPCYLEDKLAETHDHYTVFRFPLRTKASEISNEVWNEDKIKTLLKEFEDTASESLLFLQNVKMIKLSEVTTGGVLTSTRTVHVETKPSEEKKKNDFYARVSEYIGGASTGQDVTELMPACYEVYLHSMSKIERWMICQHLGRSEGSKIDEKSVRYKLLPIGGVAARLSGGRLRGKAYCFLPLPINTELPVHVHGYFALDHESRRHLWQSTNDDFQTTWNQQLCEHVIVPSYIKLLSGIRDSFSDQHKWFMPISHERTGGALKILDVYHGFFPLHGSDRYWKNLVCSIYEAIVRTRCMLFPVLEPSDENNFLLTWKTPVSPFVLDAHGNMSDVGFFTRLNEEKKSFSLKEILQRTGFPIIESPALVVSNIIKASANCNKSSTLFEVLEVKPSAVVTYLGRSNRLSSQLPISISQSVLQDKEHLAVLIEYCTSVCHLELHGLPLLLTQDGMLRIFSEWEPVFKSPYAYLFPKHSMSFLHAHFLHKLPANQKVFRDLNILAIAEMVSVNAPFLKIPLDDYLPFDGRLTVEWFKHLWDLLEYQYTFAKKTDLFINGITEKFGDCAILPTVPLLPHTRFSRRNHEICLVPLRISFTVFLSSTHMTTSLSSALQTLGILKIASDFASRPLISRLACDIDSKDKIFKLLEYLLSEDVLARFQNLTKTQHAEILSFFQSRCQYRNYSHMKRLPCFETIGGEHVSIANLTSVFLLPPMIPSCEQDAWIDSCPAVFLKPREVFADLYEGLDLSEGNLFKIYAKFILPCFWNMTLEGRLAHLLTIKAALSSDGRRKQKIDNLQLRTLAFIPGEDGVLYTASHFFDPELEVFSLMKARVDFPPDTIRQRLGLKFLREIGLQTKVTKSMFLTFARQIEGDSNAKVLSQSLVKCLQNYCHLHEDDHFLEQVGKIRFLVRRKLGQELESMHPPASDGHCCIMYSGSMIKNEELVWTVLPMLPRYAAIRTECFKCGVMDIPSTLGMITNPKLSTVLKHTSILCKSLKQNERIHHHGSVGSIMQKILTFLANQCEHDMLCKPQSKCRHCNLIEEKLGKGNVPLILVKFESAYVLVEAKQISRTVTRNLSPYLYQLPDKWGPFFWLLRILGATDKPSIAQYAFILNKLFNIGKGSVQPNVVRLVGEASRGLYKEIHESDGLSVIRQLENTSTLYLPSTQHGLKESHTLFFNDAEHLNDRIPKSELLILQVFHDQKAIMKDVIDKLPKKFQPKSLSESVKEVLDVADITQGRCLLAQGGRCDLERRLDAVLHSEELFIAIVSIVKHYSNRDMSEKERKSMRKCLSRLKVCCMQRVQVILQVDGKNIANSFRRTPAFVRDTRQLYVVHTDEPRTRILFRVARCVNRVLGNMVEGEGLAVLLVATSVKSPSEILSVLSEDGIEGITGERDDSDIRFKDSSPDSIAEAKRLVTEEVKEVLQLPQEEKSRAINRLMLRWHPDKHPEGLSELFNEAFKHLTLELGRLS
ncbi:sacsin-like [Diadema antillarum]|uniref:sacsin-like n=1 Tax=Diadema antillarum TaxID=105358 RepID=UPI003A8674A7